MMSELTEVSCEERVIVLRHRTVAPGERALISVEAYMVPRVVGRSLEVDDVAAEVWTVRLPKELSA